MEAHGPRKALRPEPRLPNQLRSKRPGQEEQLEDHAELDAGEQKQILPFKESKRRFQLHKAAQNRHQPRVRDENDADELREPRRLDAGGAKVQRRRLRERRRDGTEAEEEAGLGQAAAEDAVLGPQVRKIRHRAANRREGEGGEHERGLLFRGCVPLRRPPVRRHRGGNRLRGDGSFGRTASPRRAEDQPRNNLQTPQA